MPWDFTGLKGQINQRGAGGNWLCEECNNNTGSWYMSEYVNMSHVLHALIQKEKFVPGNHYSFMLKDVYPMRIFKAVMTMFCDINHDCFGDNNLRKYLLDKESTLFPSNKYEVYMYLISPGMCRVNSLSAMIIGNTNIMTSEISRYPVGFSLFIDKPSSYIPVGSLINDFASISYDCKGDLRFDNIPYLEVNTQLPVDFRSKNEIKRTIDETADSLNSLSPTFPPTV